MNHTELTEFDEIMAVRVLRRGHCIEIGGDRYIVQSAVCRHNKVIIVLHSLPFPDKDRIHMYLNSEAMFVVHHLYDQDI